MVTSSGTLCDQNFLTSLVNVIDIWDAKTKEKLRSLTDHSEIVTSVVIKNFDFIKPSRNG